MKEFPDMLLRFVPFKKFTILLVIFIVLILLNNSIKNILSIFYLFISKTTKKYYPQ
jgi:hypothetical protein